MRRRRAPHPRKRDATEDAAIEDTTPQRPDATDGSGATDGPAGVDGRRASGGGPGPSSVPTGVAPLDERTGGLEPGRLHLVSSPPVPARTVLVVQFLHAGLEAGERVALVTRTRPDRVFSAGERFGHPLEKAWRDRTLQVVGFRSDHEERIRGAASAEDVFVELASLLPDEASRLVFDPAAVLWEGHGRGAAASAFVDFAEDLPATVLATTTRGLDGELPLSDELVTQAAAGILELREERGGLVRLTVRKLRGGRPERPDVTLALEDDAGLVAPEGRPSRRATDRSGESDELLRITLDGPLSQELEGWLGETYEVTDARDATELRARLQTPAPYGAVVVSLGRDQLEQGRRACSICRRTRAGIPVVVVSDEPFRASDRADLLRAGADECMTGGVNVGELASRLELSRSRVGRRPAPPERAAAGSASRAGADRDAGATLDLTVSDAPPAGGATGREATSSGGGDGSEPLDEEAFRGELRQRLDDPGARVFTVIRFAADGGSAVPERLAGLVRSGSGDFAGRLGGEPAVWLAETVPTEAEGFLQRVRDEVEEAAGGAVEAEVLGGERDAARLRELAG